MEQPINAQFTPREKNSILFEVNSQGVGKRGQSSIRDKGLFTRCYTTNDKHAVILFAYLDFLPAINYPRMPWICFPFSQKCCVRCFALLFALFHPCAFLLAATLFCLSCVIDFFEKGLRSVCGYSTLREKEIFCSLFIRFANVNIFPSRDSFFSFLSSLSLAYNFRLYK